MRARIHELKKQKLSLRAIEGKLTEEGTPLSYVAVRTVLKEGEVPKRSKGQAPARAKPVQGRRGSRERVGGGAAEALGGSEGEDTDPLEPLQPLPEDADLAVREHYKMMRETRRRIQALPREASAATDYASLARVARQEARDLQAMLPPPPPDPLKDPHNLAAREMVYGQVLSTIDAVKERARKRGFRWPGDE